MSGSVCVVSLVAGCAHRFRAHGSAFYVAVADRMNLRAISFPRRATVLLGLTSTSSMGAPSLVLTLPRSAHANSGSAGNEPIRREPMWGGLVGEPLDPSGEHVQPGSEAVAASASGLQVVCVILADGRATVDRKEPRRKP
jgi:hypothetical protein